MPNLTSKELSAIEDQLAQEQLLVKKYRMYSQSATEIKTKCEQIASRHQNHYDKLFAHLN